ncbi:YbdD/YjiX family protein [Conchiformibius kuhniae]|uniref:YbdD/YjiX family protein n=1 Tax=Conchiformibius kuhniae TaxID=211502 RepID=A0A8T9MU60_9NEIS|nr:CstA-like transporter-associated (seleno)protein [Conchiformibius kuhniae]UOP04634.1 putative selenoprotein [Conchiformibius kuhniae]
MNVWQHVKRWLNSARRTADLMAGMPDYESYVARQRRHNPNAPVMSEQQFQDYCSKRRCGAGGGRCC